MHFLLRRRDEHALCRPRDSDATPTGSRRWRTRRACSPPVGCFYRHIVPDLDPSPPRGSLARRSSQLSRDDHGLASSWLTRSAACLSSDPANSAAACSDCQCAFFRRIPVILAPRPGPRARHGVTAAHRAVAGGGRRRAGRSVPIPERTPGRKASPMKKKKKRNARPGSQVGRV